MPTPSTRNRSAAAFVAWASHPLFGRIHRAKPKQRSGISGSPVHTKPASVRVPVPVPPPHPPTHPPPPVSFTLCSTMGSRRDTAQEQFTASPPQGAGDTAHEQFTVSAPRGVVSVERVAAGRWTVLQDPCQEGYTGTNMSMSNTDANMSSTDANMSIRNTNAAGCQCEGGTGMGRSDCAGIPMARGGRGREVERRNGITTSDVDPSTNGDSDNEAARCRTAHALADRGGSVAQALVVHPARPISQGSSASSNTTQPTQSTRQQPPSTRCCGVCSTCRRCQPVPSSASHYRAASGNAAHTLNALLALGTHAIFLAAVAAMATPPIIVPAVSTLALVYNIGSAHAPRSNTNQGH